MRKGPRSARQKVQLWAPASREPAASVVELAASAGRGMAAEGLATAMGRAAATEGEVKEEPLAWGGARPWGGAPALEAEGWATAPVEERAQEVVRAATPGQRHTRS